MSVTATRETPKRLLAHDYNPPDIAEGLSLLGAVAWVAGETAGATNPKCCCPVLAEFGFNWSRDMRRDAERQQLLPYVERLINTHSTPDVERRRGELATRWFIHDYVPGWLDLAGFDVHAETLRTMQNRDWRTLDAVLDAAKDDIEQALDSVNGVVGWVAVSAESAATGAAAGRAAWLASDHRVMSARWTAVNATRAAAAAETWGGAAPDQHWENLRSGAARDALEPTVAMLQRSAHQLFDEMIDVQAGASTP